MRHALALVCLSLINCSKYPQNDIKAGAAAIDAACLWVSEKYDSGALDAICATADEIAKYGKHPRPIMNARVMRDANIP